MAVEHLVRRLTIVLRGFRGGLFVGERVRRLWPRGGILPVTDFDGDLIMHLDLSEHMQAQIFWQGIYSADVIAVLRRVLSPGDTVFDCGANIGEITLIAAKRVGVAGRVYAFEPLPGFADQLERHAEENRFENITVLRAGVSSEPGKAPIFVSDQTFGDGCRNDGLGTLFPTEVRSQGAGEIELVTIDDVVREAGIQRLDLIKLDIEGAELSALRGASQVLKSLKPRIIVELGLETCRAAGYRMEDVFDLLTNFGYQMSRIGRRGSLEPILANDLIEFQNVYCVPRSAL